MRAIQSEERLAVATPKPVDQLAIGSALSFPHGRFDGIARGTVGSSRKKERRSEGAEERRISGAPESPHSSLLRSYAPTLL
jgi:hypothetical protein